MTDNREHAHQLIDQLPEMHLRSLVAAALRNAPVDDEPETEDEKREVAEARLGL